MSKKLIYTITALLFITLVVLVGYYFSTRGKAGTDSGIPNIFKNFFPFGGDSVTYNSTTTPVQNTDEPIDEPVDFVKKLRKLSTEPVAGAGILDVKAGSVVRYIEKATGHIYEVELFSPRQGRISNTTIPQVYDAVWGNKNNSLVARYLKDNNETIDTYSLTLKDVSTTTENTISGIAFPEGIDDVSIWGDTVFYLQKSKGGSYGYTSNFSGGLKKQIWNSPVNELTSQFVNQKTVALTTKQEESTEGFLYYVDTTNGSSRKILGNVVGLSTLVSGDGGDVLYVNQDGSFQMYVYNVKTKDFASVTPATFPEKCVWSKKDKTIIYCAVPRDAIEVGMLTAWYKGLVGSNDDIWKFNLVNGTSDIISNLNNESGEIIDVIKPILSESEQYLMFVNKRDNSLWSLDLTK